MRKIKKPYKKIKLYVTLSAVGIAVSIAVAAAVAIFVNSLRENWLTVAAFFATLTALGLLDYFVFKVLLKCEFKRHKKYLVLNLRETASIKNLCETKAIKIEDAIYAYIYKERMFNTVTVYLLDNDVTEERIRSLRQQAKNYYKQNYKYAQETNGRKKHHELNVQVYVCDKRNELVKSLLCKGGEQMFSIGYVRCYLCAENGEILMPFYSGSDMEISTLSNYDKAVKKLCEIFPIESINEKE